MRREERLYRKNRSNANLYNLNYSKYYFKQSILKAKKYYYFNKIQECSGNMRKLYQITNSLTGIKNKTILPNDDDISLCEKFADFFDCKIKKIIDTINSFTFNNNEPIPNLTFSKFNVPSRDTISRLILSFRKSSPRDPIHLSLFKRIDYPLSNYILTIIKLSFTKGSREYINKHAIICPIIKDHNINKNILGNSRPVSQITLISKLTEKIVNKQIIKYIEENNLLDEFQSAYRALHSTETALINVMDDFLNFKDSNFTYTNTTT